MNFSQVSFIVHINIGYKQSTGSKNQRYMYTLALRFFTPVLKKASSGQQVQQNGCCRLDLQIANDVSIYNPLKRQISVIYTLSWHFPSKCRPMRPDRLKKKHAMCLHQGIIITDRWVTCAWHCHQGDIFSPWNSHNFSVLVTWASYILLDLTVRSQRKQITGWPKGAFSTHHIHIIYSAENAVLTNIGTVLGLQVMKRQQARKYTCHRTN